MKHRPKKFIRLKSSNLQLSQQEPDVDVHKFQYDIPEWILQEVMLRLPVKSIFKFKCVSRDWLSLISDPHFARSYISRRTSSFRILYRYIYASDFQKALNRLHPEVFISKNISLSCLYSGKERDNGKLFKVLAVSNRLVLCQILMIPWTYYLCDPVTGRWFPLPPVNGTNYTCAGLVSQVNEVNVVTSYKVVCIKEPYGVSRLLNLAILSSDTGEWMLISWSLNRRVQFMVKTGPLIFNGIMHWFTYKHGMVAFDPCAQHCRLVKFPEGIDIDNVYRYEEGLYRLCDVCQGRLRYFEVAPPETGLNYHLILFKMWVLKEYEKGEWCLEHQVTRGDIWSDDPKLNDYLLGATFIPLAFHPCNLDIVYLRCIQPSCIVSYSIQSKRLEVFCHGICSEKLCWRSVMPISVLPIWPAVPSGLLKANTSS